MKVDYRRTYVNVRDHEEWNWNNDTGLWHGSKGELLDKDTFESMVESEDIVRIFQGEHIKDIPAYLESDKVYEEVQKLIVEKHEWKDKCLDLEDENRKLRIRNMELESANTRARNALEENRIDYHWVPIGEVRYFKDAD